MSADFESEVRSVFQPESNEVVIDIGACIGLYTLIAARGVGSHGKVISIEPDPANLTILKRNVDINKLGAQTLVLPIALGSKASSKKFYAGIMPSGSSFYPARARALYKVREIKIIRTISLDKLLEKLKIRDVDWIKIDVEKADLDVLRGAQSFLQNSKNVKIMIEVSCDETLEYLQRKGFQIKPISSSYYFAYKNSVDT